MIAVEHNSYFHLFSVGDATNCSGVWAGEDVQGGHLSPFAKYMLENSCISIYRWSTFVFLSKEWVLRGGGGPGLGTGCKLPLCKGVA